MSNTAAIPEQFADLVDGPVIGILSTVNPDGQPQSTPVWFDREGEYVRVNSANGRQKVKNMQARPLVTVTAVDPTNMYRWIEIRGTVEEIITEQDQAVAHIGHLSGIYRNQPDYYAGNESMRGQEERMIFKIRPTKVTARG
ncbi:MAG: PPOX class F420-dependent oxidoreductase [Pleurocapsa minor GSE-CHR-MK-17-07R]|nr:PPOX class F420-dependent oxidoreductase [Pleurocapsa minor GSE-CHR-MK 17-07R]